MFNKDPEQYKIEFETKDRLGSLFGCKFISISERECIYTYRVSKDHFNPNGILHGGALYSVMDSSQGAFVHFILDEQYKFASTGTSTIRYLAPVHEGVIKIRTYLKEIVRRKLIIISTATNEAGLEVAQLEEIWIAILK